MEIECKFYIPDDETVKAIWDNEAFADIEEEGTREDLDFDAKYFDTEDESLAAEEIAYRVRREGDHYVACLKWKGHSEDGLHVREELNVPVGSDEPDAEVFAESSVGAQVIDILDGKELKCFIQTSFNRRRFRLDTGKGIYEVSIDCGQIITPAGSCPIREVEIELFTGETEELLEIGRAFQEKYDLIPGDKSKYARGIELIKGDN